MEWRGGVSSWKTGSRISGNGFGYWRIPKLMTSAPYGLVTRAFSVVRRGSRTAAGCAQWIPSRARSPRPAARHTSGFPSSSEDAAISSSILLPIRAAGGSLRRRSSWLRESQNIGRTETGEKLAYSIPATSLEKIIEHGKRICFSVVRDTCSAAWDASAERMSGWRRARSSMLLPSAPVILPTSLFSGRSPRARGFLNYAGGHYNPVALRRRGSDEWSRTCQVMEASIKAVHRSARPGRESSGETEPKSSFPGTAVRGVFRLDPVDLRATHRLVLTIPPTRPRQSRHWNSCSPPRAARPRESETLYAKFFTTFVRFFAGWRNPGFAALAILAFALVIGAKPPSSGVVNAVLLGRSIGSGALIRSGR